MAEQKACTVLHGREDRSFQLRLSFSVTNGLSPDGSVEENVPFPSAASFKCSVKYWPHWEHGKGDKGWIRLSVVTTRTQHQAHNNVRVHIDLLARNGPQAPAIAVMRGEICGGYLIARRDDVEGECVVDGQFTALCNITVSRLSLSSPLPLLTRSSRLERDIFMASDLADVSFQVDGETFKAHRLVLAARSPVFKASLFGSMAESTASSITIEDMRASTFRSMLHYMYHGVLPVGILETMEDGASRMVEVEHLLVAADRYGLDTLKRMCEEILCADISTSTVLSKWVFAVQRSCHRLMIMCLEFLRTGENFKQVAITDEYVDLMKNAPSFGVQVRSLFKRPRIA